MGQLRHVGAGLLGYRRRIRQLLQERDALAQDAETRLRAAEGRILGLRRELARVEAELRTRDAQIKDLGAQIEAFARDPDRPTPNMLSHELNAILSSAQETAARMIERAKAVSERHLHKASHLERELHDDLARMDEWRQQALPLIRGVQSRMAEIRATLEEVAGTVAATIKPLEQFPDIDRPPAPPPAAPMPREPSVDEAAVTKLDLPEGKGNVRRPRRRPARSVPTGTEQEPGPEVVDIPDQAGAR
ncbi:MAG TPA: hypothetical protein VGL18_08830 [Actinomycetota bacterium]